MPSSIVSPFPVFNDLDGSPLENGYIYIGTSNLNPETSPVNVFWDAARTIPAAQPIRTIGGFPSRNGSPSNVYVEADTYSITVRNSRRVFVYSASGNQTPGTNISFIQAGTGAVTRNIQSKARETVSVGDFGAVGDGVTDDTAAIQAAANSINIGKSDFIGGVLVFEPGKQYKVTSTISLNQGTCIEGNKALLISYNCDALTYTPKPISGGIRPLNPAIATITNLDFKSESSNYIGYRSAQFNSYSGINVVDAGKISVLDCHFFYYHTAVWFSGCQQIAIERCVFHQCWLGVRTFGGPSYPNPTGPVTQSDAFSILKNMFDCCVYPIYFDGVGANQGPTTISGNYFFAPTQTFANDGFFMRVGIIVEAVKGCTISNNTFDAYDVYNGYIANNSVNTFVPNTVAILLDYHTAGAYLTLSNILDPNVPRVGGGDQDSCGISISDNSIRSTGYGVLIKHALGVTVSTNAFQQLTTCGVKSNNTFNAGALFNNYWFGWEGLTLNPPKYNIPYGSRFTLSEVNGNLGWQSNVFPQFGFATGGSGTISVTLPYAYIENAVVQVSPTGPSSAGTTYNTVISGWSPTGFTVERNINNGSSNSNTGAYLIFWHASGKLF